MRIDEALEARYELSINEYERLLSGEQTIRFGTKNAKINLEEIPGLNSISQDKNWLILDSISDYKRQYRWI